MRTADDPYITLTTEILYNPKVLPNDYVVVLKAIRNGGCSSLPIMEKKDRPSFLVFLKRLNVLAKRFWSADQQSCVYAAGYISSPPLTLMESPVLLLRLQ